VIADFRSAVVKGKHLSFMAIVKSAGGQPMISAMPKGSFRNSTGLLTSSNDTILGSEQTGNLQDRYELGDELGLGQFGKIRYCTDKVTGEVLACKSIAKDRLVTSEDVRSVKLEIEIMTSLSGHPNVVALKAVFEEEEYVHLVMELCAGGELFDQLQKQGRYSEPDAARLFKHLMEVVKYCHDNGVVHRDLKPENILLATKSPSSPIKLADFGLATYFTPGQKLNGTVGSPFYIAPEVLSGGYNQAADVWSAGVILYILLSGIPPFWGKTKSKIFDAVREAKLQFPKDPWSSISSSAKDLISRMLCTDPKKRLTSVEVLEHSWITAQVELSVHSRNGVKGKQGITCNSLRSGEPKTMASFSSAFDCNSKTDILSSFSGKASFSGFIVSDKGCQVLGSFAFQSHPKANGSEYSSAIQHTLSFAFANVDGAFNSEHSVSFSDNKMQHQLSQRGSSFGHLFAAAVSNSIKSVSQYVMSVEEGGGQTQKAETSRYLIAHKENHTIGLGELEQLDLKVSESIIRWASCTRLSGATSFQSPLVC
jgi:calcium-dependent protein kinase